MSGKLVLGGPLQFLDATRVDDIFGVDSDSVDVCPKDVPLFSYSLDGREHTVDFFQFHDLYAKCPHVAKAYVDHMALPANGLGMEFFLLLTDPSYVSAKDGSVTLRKTFNQDLSEDDVWEYVKDVSRFATLDMPKGLMVTKDKHLYYAMLVDLCRQFAGFTCVERLAKRCNLTQEDVADLAVVFEKNLKAMPSSVKGVRVVPGTSGGSSEVVFMGSDGRSINQNLFGFYRNSTVNGVGDLIWKQDKYKNDSKKDDRGIGSCKYVLDMKRMPFDIPGWSLEEGKMYFNLVVGSMQLSVYQYQKTGGRFNVILCRDVFTYQHGSYAMKTLNAVVRVQENVFTYDERKKCKESVEQLIAMYGVDDKVSELVRSEVAFQVDHKPRFVAKPPTVQNAITGNTLQREVLRELLTTGFALCKGKIHRFSARGSYYLRGSINSPVKIASFASLGHDQTQDEQFDAYKKILHHGDEYVKRMMKMEGRTEQEIVDFFTNYALTDTPAKKPKLDTSVDHEDEGGAY